MLLPVLWVSMLGAPPPDDALSVQWRGTAACVDSGVLTSRVEELMGGPPPGATLSLSADEGEHGWTITLRLDGPTRALRRRLEGRDCDTLTAAVALVVAVQLDPVAVADVVWPEPTPAFPSPKAAPVEPTAVVPARAAAPAPEVDRSSTERGPAPPSEPPTDDPDRRPGLRTRLVAGATASAELGVLPRGAAAFALTVGTAWPRARVELGGLASVGPDAATEELPSVGGRFRLLTGQLRACGVMARGRAELPLCGGLELGRLRATGTGLREPATVDAPWIALSAGARPQWVPVPRVAIGAALELLAPLQRHRFTIAEAGLVHEVATIGARLGLHLELRLP